MILLLPLIFLTLQRNEVWRNSETLWLDHLKDYPRSPKGLLNIGVYYYHHRKNYARAEQFFRQLVSVQPRYMEGYRYLAQSARDAGHSATALAVYQRALQIWPQEKKLHNDMGYAYFTFGHDQEAVAAYKAALALDSQYTLAQLNIGIAALRLPDYPLARDAFTMVLRQIPRQPVAAGGLCLALSVLDELKQAAQQCALAVRLQPTNGRYLGEFAGVLLRLQRPEAALQVAQRAVTVAPQLALSYRVLGDTYAALSRIGQATTAYQSALQINPTDDLSRQGLKRLQHQSP